MKSFMGRHRLILPILLLAIFLRFFNITNNPPSLFGDEVDLGYHAYSISQTGRDYQGNFMPLHFRSLAEWRTPLYLYSAVPTVALFGITPLGVRLPAAIFGVLSIWAFYLLIKEMINGKWLMDKRSNIKHHSSFINHLPLIASFLLAISPWHLQYSRAGFEVTQLLFFLTMGLYLFYRSLGNGKWLWLSVTLLVLTPLIYSTAKFFTPVLLVFLFIAYKRDILSISARHKIYAVIAGLVVGIPIIYTTLFGGGSQRFGYIGVFSDPIIEPEVGFSRLTDARMRGETGLSLSPTFIDRAIHNKFTFVGERILKNYLQSFSTEFLFIKGDPNPRHSIGIGGLYRIEIIALVMGIIFFFSSKSIPAKTKIFIATWILLAPIPAAITRDGGNHATRLILLLPPLIFLISYGIVEGLNRLPSKLKNITAVGYLAVFILSFGLYLHEYYVHYPWNSERWWHAGWGEAVTEIKNIDKGYDRVIISMSGEPAWIFFAGHYQYPPDLWQKEFPVGRDGDVPGFGSISHTGKFYFGSPREDIKIYGLGDFIDSKTLYLANAGEVGANLITEPERTPAGLTLIKSIAYPSGEPAFYIFSGN
jgi:4-amino-4-deoxy-L-arabinose transferase-like glycosyltransferase